MASSPTRGMGWPSSVGCPKATYCLNPPRRIDVPQSLLRMPLWLKWQETLISGL